MFIEYDDNYDSTDDDQWQQKWLLQQWQRWQHCHRWQLPHQSQIWKNAKKILMMMINIQAPAPKKEYEAVEMKDKDIA